MNESSELCSFLASTQNTKIKPLKKTRFCLYFDEDQSPEKRQRILQRNQVKNPKWVSFAHEASYEEDYSELKYLQKCKSLQLISLSLQGRRVGATVGHFLGEIKHLERVSKYLKRLDFGAGAVSKRRFINLRRWIKRRKHVSDLSLVPYWFPAEKEDDVEDWHSYGCKTTGVIRLIHLFYAQIRRLGFSGYVIEGLEESLDFKKMKKLQQFTLKAAFRPGGCYEDCEEFGDTHLDFIKKAIKCKTLVMLTLYSEYPSSPKEFWVSLKNLLVSSIERPLVVDSRVDSIFCFGDTKKWFKEIFADLPANIKVNFTVHDTSYFLSLPSGIEVVGKHDSDDDEESEGDEDEDSFDDDKEDGKGRDDG